ncbi:unnamed protein product [Clonostachys rhizophaga]|uniref:Uncharacterized protein n=1 Tax=Clonostachys rhizophaga TaxID=160324 RepID=A0A9N9VS08_9HYPO|nr:unnamed protein product [Clonostachys rhizophaga]
MDEIRASIQNTLDAEFPRCAVIQAERHPLSSMARCRSHGTHLLSAEACEMAIHAVPFRSAMGPECEDQIWEYQFLPPSVALIADKIKVTPWNGAETILAVPRRVLCLSWRMAPASIGNALQ